MMSNYRRQKKEIASEKNEIYKQHLKQMTPRDVEGDILFTLKKLKEEGVKIAIGSSSKNARMILERIGLDELFDAISDGNNITKSKPDPEVFIKAADFLNLKPEECLVVEDAVAGIDAGNAGGFDTAAVGDAAKYEKSDYRLNTLSDLLKILSDKVAYELLEELM